MCTQNQLDANRRNSQLSTGPLTEAGKKAIRSNALKHGFYSGSAVLTRVENREEFDDLHADFIDHYQPVGPVEMELASRVVLALWQLRRVENAEHQSVSLDVMNAGVSLPKYYNNAAWCTLGYAVREDMRSERPTFAAFDRHRAHWNRNYYQAVKELDRLQRNRPSPSATPSNQKQNSTIGFDPQNPQTDTPPQATEKHPTAPEVAATSPAVTASTVASGTAKSPSNVTATPSNQTSNQGNGFVPQKAPADLPKAPAVAPEKSGSQPRESAQAELPTGAPLSVSQETKPPMPPQRFAHNAAKRLLNRENPTIGFVPQNIPSTAFGEPMGADLESTFAEETY
jgi:hypothetical protein